MKTFYDWCIENNREDLLKEWHPTKNGVLTLNDIGCGSNELYWWICTKGHEWQARPSARRRAGCPYCANRKLLTGYNDLVTTHPEIAKEWHPSKNGDLKPTQISAGSHYVVWWKCSKCEYEYQEEVRKKVRKKYICPNCREII